MRLKEILVLGTFLFVFVTVGGRAAFADPPSPYGPEGKRFGVGLHLGEPTGFSLKGYLAQRWALDGIAAWSFSDEAFTIIGDATYDILDIPVETSVITLPFYVGGGVKIAINAGQNDNTTFGMRVPVGLSVQWVKYPVEIFLEIAPGIGIAPDTEFDFTGGIGARFYF